MQTFTDIVRHRFILENLVAKNLKALYRNMALGFFWSILNPLVMVVVLTIVQLRFFGASSDYPSLLMVGLIPYNFFAYCLSGSASSIISNASLVKKVKFPRQILPVSVIVTSSVHFAIQALLIVATLILFRPPQPILGAQLLWLPIVLGLNLALVMGLALLVSALNVVYRDVQYIVDSALTVLFWMSPVVYDASNLAAGPAWQYWAYFANPLAGILAAYRSVLYHGSSPDLVALGMAAAVTLVVGVFGVRSFWIHERNFADLI